MRKGNNLMLATVSVFLLANSSMALESTHTNVQARTEDGKLLISVSGGPGGPAAEIVSLMEKAQVPNIVDSSGNPTYQVGSAWAYSLKQGERTAYAFFTRIPLNDTHWSLTAHV